MNPTKAIQLERLEGKIEQIEREAKYIYQQKRQIEERLRSFEYELLDYQENYPELDKELVESALLRVQLGAGKVVGVDLEKLIGG